MVSGFGGENQVSGMHVAVNHSGPAVQVAQAVTKAVVESKHLIDRRSLFGRRDTVKITLERSTVNPRGDDNGVSPFLFVLNDLRKLAILRRSPAECSQMLAVVFGESKAVNLSDVSMRPGFGIKDDPAVTSRWHVFGRKVEPVLNGNQ